MAKNTDKGRNSNAPRDPEDDIRQALDEQGGDSEKFDPRGGEDPGLLELTEDPRERRLKRHTM